KDLRGIRCFIAWTALGMFATGITITNIVPIIILFWLREIYNRNRVSVSIVKVLGLATLILALTFSLQVIILFAMGIDRPSLKQEAGWIQMFGTKNIHSATRKFLTFPAVFVDSIIAPEPKQKPNKFAIEMNPAARYPFQFSFDYDDQGRLRNRLLSTRNLAGIALLLLLLLPIRALSNVDRSLLLLSRGAWLIIVFNVIFHSLWGSERFLYSQHWHVPLFFLFAVFVSTQLRSSRMRNSLVMASVILFAINNVMVVRTILITLLSK
ncbi:MAG: hypothetical protein JSW07_01505, partial [bacterium]